MWSLPNHFGHLFNIYLAVTAEHQDCRKKLNELRLFAGKENAASCCPKSKGDLAHIKLSVSLVPN